MPVPSAVPPEPLPGALPDGPPPHATPPAEACVVRRVPRYEPAPETGPLARPRLRALPGGGAPAAGPAEPSTPRADPVDPAALVAAQHVLRTTLEVLDRRRPAAHLAQVLAPALAQRVGATLAAGRAGGPPAQLRSVHVQQAGPRAAEVFGRLERGPRCRLVAARLELTRGRWLATALRVG